MTPEYLNQLVRNIRVGSPASDVDKLADVSDGMLNCKTLGGRFKADWPFEQRKPCSMTFTQDGFVKSISFTVGQFDVAGLDPKADLAAVRQSFPEHSDIFFGQMMTEEGNVMLNLGRDAAGVIIACQFKDGQQKRLEFWSDERLEEFEADWRMYEEHIALKEFKTAARKSGVQSEWEKTVEWERTAHPDEVFRSWIDAHVTDGNQADEWVKFGNWLMHKSTPVQRHRIATGFNWSHGLYIANWIIQQPSTQLATAYSVFWLAEPSYYVSMIARNEQLPSYNLQTLEMLEKIAKNIRENFYDDRGGRGKSDQLLRWIA